MAMAIPIMMVVGAAVSAVGAVRQAQAQAGAARYNAQIAEQNSQIATAQGNAAAEAQSRDAQRKMGAMVASYGAAGVDVSSGSPADVLADSARSAALDNLTIRYNSKLRAMGFDQQAALDRSTADNADTAGYINATSSLLQGAGKAFGSGGFGGGTGNVNTT